MSTRDFDLILQGATGFTGQLTAAELAAQAPEGLRWAVAGRDPARVEALAAQHGVPAIVADGLDPQAVSRLAASTRVVLTCAGPFARYGTPLFEACVTEGTHYADQTGERHWVAGLIAAHHQRAAADGTTLIPASGFDSVPADLGVQQLLERFPDTTRVHGFFRMKGGLNGGTLATVLDVGERGVSSLPGNGPRTFSVPALHGWAAPFALAEMNEATVRRSAELDDARLRYSEHTLNRSRLSAFGMSAGLATMGAMMGSSFGRGLLRRLGPSPGEGPSDKLRREGWVDFIALAGDLAAPSGSLRWFWPGDPGNTVTTRCLAQTGLALAAGEALRGGVLTAATALGAGLRERLRRRGAFTEKLLTEV